MSSQLPPRTGHSPTASAVRHRLPVVLLLLLLGLASGWYFSSSSQVTYTSTARVLLNPTSGNPFVPTPSSVRQDEATSLETEAQVMRSDEVLGAVSEEHPEWTVRELQRGLSVVVPPNTQILELTFTNRDAATAQAAAQAVAEVFLENRYMRFAEVNDARVERIQTRTATVVDELRAATEAAQVGGDGERLFQSELAEALRNELVSLRAQRTALESAEAPAGTVISPASSAVGVGGLTALVMPIGGGIAGLTLGVIAAIAIGRLRGRVRTPHDVEAAGLPVLAAVPRRRLAARLRRTPDATALDTTLRRLRAGVLDLEPRPSVITVAPVGRGVSDRRTAEALAQSLARAGHGVTLVRADLSAAAASAGIESRDGLSELLMYDRLDALALLQPTGDPLLSVLPEGTVTAQSRDLLVADRLRSVVSTLTDAGHLVVIEAAGVDTPEGEAAIGAADLSVAVVTRGRSLARDVAQAVTVRDRGAAPAALLVGPGGLAPVVGGASVNASTATSTATATDDDRTRATR